MVLSIFKLKKKEKDFYHYMIELLIIFKLTRINNKEILRNLELSIYVNKNKGLEKRDQKGEVKTC